MGNKYVIDESTLTDIADAIRTKTGKSDQLKPNEMPSEIQGITAGTEDLNAVLTEQAALISDLQDALQGKAGGGGSLGDLTKYAAVTVKPSSTGALAVDNPLGGVARKIVVTAVNATLTSTRKIQKYVADADLGIGVMEAQSTSETVHYSAKRDDASVGNGEFRITDGRIELRQYSAANTWDTAAEYKVEVWQ